MSHRGEWWFIGWGNDTASLQRIVRRLTINSFNEKEVELAVVSQLTINIDGDRAMGSVVGYLRFLDSPFHPFMFSAEYVHDVPFLERRTIHCGDNPRDRAEDSPSGTHANRSAKKCGG